MIGDLGDEVPQKQNLFSYQSILIQAVFVFIIQKIYIFVPRGGSRNIFWGGQTKVHNRKLGAKPESRARSARVSRAKPESRARSARESRAKPESRAR